MELSPTTVYWYHHAGINAEMIVPLISKMVTNIGTILYERLSYIASLGGSAGKRTIAAINLPSRLMTPDNVNNVIIEAIKKSVMDIVKGPTDINTQSAQYYIMQNPHLIVRRCTIDEINSPASPLPLFVIYTSKGYTNGKYDITYIPSAGYDLITMVRFVNKVSIDGPTIWHAPTVLQISDRLDDIGVEYNNGRVLFYKTRYDKRNKKLIKANIHVLE